MNKWIHEYIVRLDPIVSDNLGYGTKGLQFQSYKNAKKKGDFL